MKKQEERRGFRWRVWTTMTAVVLAAGTASAQTGYEAMWTGDSSTLSLYRTSTAGFSDSGTWAPRTWMTSNIYGGVFGQGLHLVSVSFESSLDHARSPRLEIDYDLMIDGADIGTIAYIDGSRSFDSSYERFQSSGLVQTELFTDRLLPDFDYRYSNRSLNGLVFQLRVIPDVSYGDFEGNMTTRWSTTEFHNSGELTAKASYSVRAWMLSTPPSWDIVYAAGEGSAQLFRRWWYILPTYVTTGTTEVRTHGHFDVDAVSDYDVRVLVDFSRTELYFGIFRWATYEWDPLVNETDATLNSREVLDVNDD